MPTCCVACRAISLLKITVKTQRFVLLQDGFDMAVIVESAHALVPEGSPAPGVPFAVEVVSGDQFGGARKTADGLIVQPGHKEVAASEHGVDAGKDSRLVQRKRAVIGGAVK